MITKDYSRDELLSDQALSLMKDYYMKEGEKSPQDAFARAAFAFCAGDVEFAQRIYDYASKQWFMFSSPILSNAPESELCPYVNSGISPIDEPKGMPISCFLNYVPDTIEGIIRKGSETRWLSVNGGGVGGAWSAVRAPDKKSPGVIPFMADINAAMTAYKQGETRKGAYAAYLDVSHPSIREFLQVRVPTGGDVNRKMFNIHHAVNVSDDFMEAVKRRSTWSLKDPKDGKVIEEVDAFDLWCEILSVRFRTGEPYINFIDAANRGLNPYQKEKGLTIKSSNLCNEIHLVTDVDRTAVCCLSSVNIEKYDEWKDTELVEDLIRFLDNVIEFFITHAGEGLECAVWSAQDERSLGLGAMGWHGYLQSKRIPFESSLAVSSTHRIFNDIKTKAEMSSEKLAIERGEPSDIRGSGRRNAHLLAVAPNANSSILCGCSPSIEPIRDNAYSHRTRAGTHLVKNKHLERLLEELGHNTREVWSEIINADGSVQGLEFISEYDKDVFKTFGELDMHWVVEQAAARQEYLCQGQSLNLFFPEGSSRQYVRSVHELGWRKNLKGFYYLRTSSGASTDKVGVEIKREALIDTIVNEEEDCLSCQG